MLKQFPRKSEIIRAIQFTGDNVDEIKAAVSNPDVIFKEPGLNLIEVRFNRGVAMAAPGDWIIEKEGADIYPCKDEVFKLIAEIDHEIPSHLPDHMKRVFVEVKQLDQKLAALGSYLADGAKHSSPEEKRLQQEQFDYMDDYSKTLHLRLTLYKKPTT